MVFGVFIHISGIKNPQHSMLCSGLIAKTNWFTQLVSYFLHGF
ncbi:hypothetical protein GCHA_1539 [Paraglaciecola chathamensis S18K6]|uniref:Uncharacterized protein n=1 Tax=Paraglaciecola chathamensis S18K6 TaxID=1127672 RepID=A0AAV3UWB0_9ALTE|nr:hypothetical protein GCHA_1539 [Paraglaciecola chathamensis S18K6]